MSYAAPIRRAEAKQVGLPTATRPRRHVMRQAPAQGCLQPKLALGAPTDRFEREADHAAAHVVGGHTGLPSLSALSIGSVAQRDCASCEEEARNAIQRKCSACGTRLNEEASTPIQRKCAKCEASGGACICEKAVEDEHPELHIARKAKRTTDHGGEAIRAVEHVISTPGRPLPAALRHEMEVGFGRDFSKVRIHDTPRAAASAEAIGAHAYTVGNHIAFNRGQFQPDTRSGRFLLAHELAHTVQQSGAPAAKSNRISQPADRHEAEANRAANAAVSGAPVPALSPGGAEIGRFGLRDIGEGIYDLGAGAVEGVTDIAEGAVDLAEDAYDFASDVFGGIRDTVVAIAEAIGGSISFDGLTMVIDFGEIDPCPDIGFDLALSDIGLDPTLYFPIAAGGLTVGPLSVIGAMGITLNIDPRIGFRLLGCTLGPGQIRVRPIPPRLSIQGEASIKTAGSIGLYTALGLRGDGMGLLVIPTTTPPTILFAPHVGITAGGALSFLLQGETELKAGIRASMGLGGVSSGGTFFGGLKFGADLGAGLFGIVDIAGLPYCRVAWPLFDFHRGFMANLNLGANVSVGVDGVSFGFHASASAAGINPLKDLSFVFDQSRLTKDDCPLCDYFKNNNLMPGQNGKNWENVEPQLPRLDGPLPLVYARDPQFTSGALCRGTCGVDCPPKPSCSSPWDRVECRQEGEKHYWYTYRSYASCGSHQGCRDHDACYDFAATDPIWGYGGVAFGLAYRACDLEAGCKYSFKQGLTWAMGGGPYDSRLRYADKVERRPGCYGPCPQNVAEEGEPEQQETCLSDRELWAGLQRGQSWQRAYGPWPLYRGFIEVPWIGGIHYGLEGSVELAADAGAELGPINLENACLTYDPATQTYSGRADLVAYLAGYAGASVTGTLTGWGADVLCLARWLSLHARLTGGVSVQLPGEVRARVRLLCQDGDLEVIPDLSMKVCPRMLAQLIAGLQFDVLSFKVWSREWKLWEDSIQQCWEIGFEFDPFILGEAPNFQLFTDSLDVGALLAGLFDDAHVRDFDHRPPRSPIADRSVLLPCLDDDDDDEDDKDCPRRANSADAIRIIPAADRLPRFGQTRQLTITAGATEPVATSMEATHLTIPHPDGEETHDGVQPNIYRQPGLPTRGCMRSGYKQSQIYIKGHLLNANIGGPAEGQNLFPITGQANSDHKTRVEQQGLNVVGRVNSGAEVIYYKVTVTNVSAPREIRTSAGASTNLFEIDANFHCEVANYLYCNNDTLKKNPVQAVDIPSSFVFNPSGGRPFDTIMKPQPACPRTGGGNVGVAQPKLAPGSRGNSRASAASAAHHIVGGTSVRTGGLPTSLRSGVESLSGLSMDDVHVLRNSPEPAKFDALALTRGTEIHLAPGQDQHLPHEAWHVVQQKQGRVTATGQINGAPINAESNLEREADDASDKLANNAIRRSATPLSSVRSASDVIQRKDKDEEFTPCGPMDMVWTYGVTLDHGPYADNCIIIPYDKIVPRPDPTKNFDKNEVLRTFLTPARLEQVYFDASLPYHQYPDRQRAVWLICNAIEPGAKALGEQHAEGVRSIGCLTLYNCGVNWHEVLDKFSEKTASGRRVRGIILKAFIDRGFDLDLDLQILNNALLLWGGVTAAKVGLNKVPIPATPAPKPPSQPAPPPAPHTPPPPVTGPPKVPPPAIGEAPKSAPGPTGKATETPAVPPPKIGGAKVETPKPEVPKVAESTSGTIPRVTTRDPLITDKLKSDSAGVIEELKRERAANQGKIDGINKDIEALRSKSTTYRQEAQLAKVSKQPTPKGQKLMQQLTDAAERQEIAQALKRGKSPAVVQEKVLLKKAKDVESKIGELEQKRNAPAKRNARIDFDLKKLERILSIPEKAGGSHKEISKKTKKRDSQSHHPVAVDAYEGRISLTKNEGPAIYMLEEDHVRTASHGSSEMAIKYRADQRALVDQGRFKEALKMDFDDLRMKFKDGRYEKAIQQAERYFEQIDPAKLKPLPQVKNPGGGKK